MVFRKSIPDKFLVIVGELMIVCRILEPLFDTKFRMIISGLGVGCFMLFFPVFLLHEESSKEEQHGLTLGMGLAIAIASSVLLRVLNSTIDISTFSWFQVIGWILAVIETMLLVGFFFTSQKKISRESPSSNNAASPTGSTDERQPSSTKHLLGITLGLSSVLFFVCFAFSSPVVISRWTEGDYFLITVIIVLMLVLFVTIASREPQLITKLKKPVIWAWNGLFVLAFVLIIIVNQVPFPATPGSYPIEAPPTTFLYHVPLVLMLITFPIILIDFVLLSREILKLEPKPTAFTVGGSFTLGSGLYMIIMIFSLIFTSTWGFIPLIGVFFRDLFWFVFLIVGLVVLVSLARVSKSSLIFQKSLKDSKTNIINIGFMVIILVATIVSVIVIEARPASPTGEVNPVRILTYNLQQGVNENATKNYDGQLELVRGVDADIIGLQETSKIAGNSDVVRYFANNLNLYSYFGPKGVTGTTGVALLSKYPIENPKTFYHYSENVDRKQTATIEAEITIGTITYTVYVTHTFGRTSAKSILQTDVLNRASGKNDIIFMGDFNFRPNSEPYNLTTEVLDDSWWNKWPTGVDNQGNNNSQRIDLIFVSPGTTISDCRYILDPQSDHPAYWAEIQR
jgi:endonuclease/exonuclease/phosphatase family metal-dependent hydrolase